MLNPSTADHRVDDPTIRRCIDFARRWGHGSLLVVNLFAFRTHEPAELMRALDPIGPKNDHYLDYAWQRANAMVVAWGVHGRFMGRHGEVLCRLEHRKKPLLCLGRTKDGFPRHPLYLPGATRPEPWDGHAADVPSVP